MTKTYTQIPVIRIDFMKYSILDFWATLPDGLSPEQVANIKGNNAHQIMDIFEKNNYPPNIAWELVEFNYLCSKHYKSE